MSEPPATNPYSELSFWRFGLLAAVVVAFPPWSLLVHGLLKGFGDTKVNSFGLIIGVMRTSSGGVSN